VSKKLRLAGSIVLLAFLAWRTDWRQIATAFAGLRTGWWLLAIAVYAATQVVSSLRWCLLAGPLGFRNPFRQFVAYYSVGMFFNLVLPTSVGGDVVRAWYLDGGSGRKVSAFLSVFADRASGLLMLIAIACIAAVCSPLHLPPRITGSVYGIAAAAVLGLGTLFLLARYRAPTTDYPVLRMGWRARVDRLLDFTRDAQSALLPGPRLFLVTTLLSVVVQAANVCVLWLAGRALGVDVPASYYWILAPVVSLMTLFPISLNGLGVREWGMVLMLAPLGVGSESATALSFLWFLTISAVSVTGAGCYLFGRFPRFEVRPDDERVGGDSDQGRERQSSAAA
jgi:glycosyltransferase 2 family protein